MVFDTALFATALFEVIKTLAEKAVVEPALKKGLEDVQARLTQPHDLAKAQEEWVDAMQAALQEMGEEVGTLYPMNRAKLYLPGLRTETRRLLVFTAVAMARAELRKIPALLLSDLNLKDADRHWLAVYLAYLRKNLAGREFYQPLIAYADNLEQRGVLDGLAKDMERVAENTLALTNYVKMIAARWHLTDNDEKALEKYLDLGRKDWGTLMLPMIKQRIDEDRVTGSNKSLFHFSCKTNAPRNSRAKIGNNPNPPPAMDPQASPSDQLRQTRTPFRTKTTRKHARLGLPN